MKVVLIAGGSLDEVFCMDYLKNVVCDKLIAVDRGLAFLHKMEIKPDLIVGDFDSLSAGILDSYKENTEIREFVPEKDATDMEIGIRAALDMGADSISILGGTGTRIDHLLGNVQVLMLPLKKGADACIMDANNRIRLIDREKNIRKSKLFGTYVSFFPLTTQVTGLNLTGFKYPLHNHTLTSDNSLGVSNEAVEDEVLIQLKEGVLIMVESRD